MYFSKNTKQNQLVCYQKKSKTTQKQTKTPFKSVFNKSYTFIYNNMKKLLISLCIALFFLTSQTTYAFTQKVYENDGISYFINWDNSYTSSITENTVHIELVVSQYDNFPIIQFVANSIINYFVFHPDVDLVKIHVVYNDDNLNGVDEYHRIIASKYRYEVLHLQQQQPFLLLIFNIIGNGKT